MVIKRRDFIKSSMIAGLGSSLTTPRDFPVPGEQSIDPAKKKKVIVAGAGISGLCCAYELMTSGHEVTVLEANGRHGGHVFTGRDGLSDGLYADYGADHITKPGYERFFEYAKKFNLPVLDYPHAEGSDAAPNRNGLRMIEGKFYTDKELSDPAVLKKFGFNEKEVTFLQSNPWYALRHSYLKPYLGKVKDPDKPLGVGLDDLDKIPLSDILKKEGASEAALKFMGGKGSSALFNIWRYDVMAMRGIPLSHGDTYRLKNGNQELPNAFAKQLGGRVKLAHTIVAISRSESGVTIKYKAFGYDEEQQMTVDYLVNCIPLPVFRKIPVTPALSAGKQYVVD
ncbi:MAG: FAD-dependent oxidoreductase, partial [Chitinophagaceae bacterium]|nr:FAD-dependent oxidoreductase [Chitinophagaceae bacterium]